MNSRIALAGLTVVAALLTQGSTADPRDLADREVKRLPPSAFAALLPDAVLKKLESRGCTIPQTFASSEPHNVIRGQFARKGQFDWAVLCSVQRVSSILVFWGGRAQCASSLASAPDKYSIQDIGGGKLGYSWKIAVADKDYILSRNPDLRSVSIDHEGIDDIFVGKASIVRYCDRGKWLELRGGD